jgi:hypothetical protein
MEKTYNGVAVTQLFYHYQQVKMSLSLWPYSPLLDPGRFSVSLSFT